MFQRKTPLIKVDRPNYDELLQTMIAQHNEAYLQQQQQQSQQQQQQQQANQSSTTTGSNDVTQR